MFGLKRTAMGSGIALIVVIALILVSYLLGRFTAPKTPCPTCPACIQADPKIVEKKIETVIEVDKSAGKVKQLNKKITDLRRRNREHQQTKPRSTAVTGNCNILDDFELQLLRDAKAATERGSGG